MRTKSMEPLKCDEKTVIQRNAAAGAMYQMWRSKPNAGEKHVSCLHRKEQRKSEKEP